MKPATTVTKVCRILDQFKNRPSLGITELARSLDLLPSDVHRIVNSLQCHGYVEQDPETRRYHLGAGLLRLSLTTSQRNTFQEKGRSVLVRLSARLDASTHLGLLDLHQCEVFLADQVEHPSLSVFRSRLGSTAGLHSTALGKTITEMPALEKELEIIRQRGYAIDREESAEGACCIGSPLRNCTGMVIGAVSASMKASHFRTVNQNHLASLVNAAAAELSGLLGYDPRSADQYRNAG